MASSQQISIKVKYQILREEWQRKSYIDYVKCFVEGMGYIYKTLSLKFDWGTHLHF